MINRFVDGDSRLDDTKVGCDDDSVDDQENKKEHRQPDDDSEYITERLNDIFSFVHSVPYWIGRGHEFQSTDLRSHELSSRGSTTE